MKRIVKKNQIILTLLAVMIAVAGYLSYAGKFKFPGGEQKAQAGAGMGETMATGLLDISDEDILAENQALRDVHTAEEGEEQAVFETVADGAGTADSATAAAAKPGGEADAEGVGSGIPGEAVLTNGMTVTNYVSQAQLSREQVRSKNKETLLKSSTTAL